MKNYLLKLLVVVALTIDTGFFCVMLWSNFQLQLDPSMIILWALSKLFVIAFCVINLDRFTAKKKTNKKSYTDKHGNVYHLN